MRMRGRFVSVVCMMALIAGACGSEGGSTEPDTESNNSPTTVSTNSPSTSASADTGSAGDEGGQAESNDPGSAAGLPPGGTGTVTIDGETIEPAWVGNCAIDEQFDPQPGDLDVSVSLDGGLEALFLEVYMIEEMGVTPEDSYISTNFRPELQLRSESGSYVSYEPPGYLVTGPDGTWYLDEIGNVSMALARGTEHGGVVLSEPPIVIDGDRLTGAVALEGDDGPIQVTFDLTITAPVDCSL